MFLDNLKTRQRLFQVGYASLQLIDLLELLVELQGSALTLSNQLVYIQLLLFFGKLFF